MAQYICIPPEAADTTPALPSQADGNPTFIPTAELLAPHIAHTFLIRSPEKAVPSYYKLCSGDKAEVTGFHYFDKNEVGLSEVRRLYEFISSQTSGKKGVGTAPILIDSADLLENPTGYMRAYCESVGVEYDEGMLSWEAGEQEHFAKWPGFHEYVSSLFSLYCLTPILLHSDAQQSSGIRTPTKRPSTSEVDYPQEVQDAIAENMADYEWLRERRLQL